MQHELEYQADRSRMMLRTSGVASVAGFERMAQATVEHPDWRAGTDLLVDHTGLDVSSLTQQDIWDIVNALLRFNEQVGESRCAIVMSDALAFGLGRMWESMADGQIPYDTRICKSTDEALRWLDGESIDDGA